MISGIEELLWNTCSYYFMVSVFRVSSVVHGINRINP